MQRGWHRVLRELRCLVKRWRHRAHATTSEEEHGRCRADETARASHCVLRGSNQRAKGSFFTLAYSAGAEEA